MNIFKNVSNIRYFSSILVKNKVIFLKYSHFALSSFYVNSCVEAEIFVFGNNHVVNLGTGYNAKLS